MRKYSKRVVRYIWAPLKNSGYKEHFTNKEENIPNDSNEEKNKE